MVASSEESHEQSCTVCPSNTYIWEEEIALVRAMNEIKQQVRAAKSRGECGGLDALRERFSSLRAQVETVRRRRLDSLGHYDYD